MLEKIFENVSLDEFEFIKDFFNLIIIRAEGDENLVVNYLGRKILGKYYKD